MKISVRSRDGSDHEIEAKAGSTVMELIRDGLPENPFAVCGGNCSCGTCHVYVAAECRGWLGAIGADENDVLDGLNHRAEGSRLACQLPFSADLDGLRVQVAPEE